MNIAELNKVVRSKGFLKYLKNTSWLMGGRITQMGVSFLVTAKVGKYLGADGFGALGYSRSLGMLFLVFAGLGLQQIVVRNLIKDRANERKILGTALILRFLGAVAAFLAYFVLSFFLPDDQVSVYLTYLVIASGVFQALDVFDYHFQSTVQAHFGVKSRSFSTFAFAFLQLFLVVIEADLIWFGWAFFIRNALVGIGQFVWFTRHFERPYDLSWDTSHARNMLIDGWPLVFSGMVVMVYMKVDQIMIKQMMDNVAVGYYTSALRFSEIWFFLGPVLASSFFPAIMNAKEKDEKLYLERLQNFYNLNVWVALAISIPMAVFGPWFLQLPFLFGEKFAPAGPVLVLHIWSLVFVFLGAASSKQMIAENLQKITLYRTLLGALVNIALNFVLIPYMGIRGAAIATLISQAVASYLGYLISRKTWGTFIMQTKALTFYSLFEKLLKKAK
ncbi:MAG: flippase [Bacteroidia bacterium]